MPDINSLNPEQREAACHFRGPTMILAGAGTGKTRVITTRIAWMIAQGVNPRECAAMTFTNKAAKEMRERIAKMTAPAVSKKLTISTFHSFCLQFLRQWPSLFGLSPGFTLVGTGDQQDLVRRALEEKGWTGLYKVDELHYQIGQCKNWLVTVDDLKHGRTPPHLSVQDPELLSVIYSLYERQLTLNRAIDFDDCILKMVVALRKDDELKRRINRRYKYYLVDEFQDTNAGQFAVLEELAREHGNVCVVGDDDQSIYSWRGAMYETLERFEKVFEGTKLIRLEQNYRCTNVILDAANTVIKNNKRRKDKTLWSDSKDQQPIRLTALPDSTAEARYIAEKCLSLFGRGRQGGDIAILYRANNQAKAIELALREARIFYKTYGGQSFFERKEVRDFLAYLRLILSPDDRLALWRIINVPTRGIGLKTQELAEQIAISTGRSPWEVMKDPGSEHSFPPASFKNISSFVSMIEELRTMPLSTPEQCQALGDEIIKRSGLTEHVKKEAKHVLARQHKVNNLMSLPGWISQVAQGIYDEQGSLNGKVLMDALCLGDEKPGGKEEANETMVSLMTVHASKGLEFPVVFVAGLEEGLMPHKNSLETDDQVCEERRLFYVALTRAKKELFLSWARIRQSGFQKESRKKSRFLAEMPDDPAIVDIEDDTTEDLNPLKKQEINKQNTANKLSMLRKSLSQEL